MVEEEMGQALDAIHYEAFKLAMRDDLPKGVQDGLDLIVLISAHKHDVRITRGKQTGGEQ